MTKLLLLTVFLTVVQTVPPVPLQTPDSSADTTQKHNNQTGGKQKPTNSPPNIASKEQPVTPDGNAKDQPDKNTNNPVRISELPPVTINGRRDWADWGTWGFTLLLAVTSVLQVWLLIKTLKINARQAEIAQKQETQMVEAGAQTERIIAQMKEAALKELRAYVGVSEIRLDVSDPTLPTGAVEIKNFGKTPAYNVRHWTAICPQTYPLTIFLPEFAATSFSVAILHPKVKNVGAVTLKKRLPNNVPIGTPQLTIYVYGEVTYEDAFGNQRYTKFRFFYGGLEPTFIYQETPDGPVFGAMRPHTDGNDAN